MDEKPKVKIWEESKKIWKIGFPAILARLSIYGVLVVTQAFIGQVSDIDLAAYAFIQVVSARFVNAILLGMSSATETLCGQAFGAGKYNMLGIYLQRSWIINLIIASIMLPVYIFAAPIYRLLGQDEEVANAAGKISLYFIPMLYQFALNMNTQQYLQAQLRNRIVGWLAGGALVIHVFLSWIFVYKMRLAVSGAMIALIVSVWLTVLGQFVYVFGGWCPDTWTGFTMAAFSDLWPVVKLSVSSGAMLCLEIWYNGVLVLLSGYMKNAEIAVSAFSICLNVIACVFMISLGFQAVACVRVANELGRRDAKAVKFSIKVVLCTSTCIGVLFWILCLVFGRDMAYLFTNNEKIVESVTSLSVYLAFTVLLNSIQAVFTGVAVGGGRQGMVAYLNIVSYYMVGVPVGALLAFGAHMQIKGIWIGMMTGMVVQTLVLGYITWKTDWDDQVKKSSEHLKRWSLKPSDESNQNSIQE